MYVFDLYRQVVGGALSERYSGFILLKDFDVLGIENLDLCQSSSQNRSDANLGPSMFSPLRTFV